MRNLRAEIPKARKRIVTTNFFYMYIENMPYILIDTLNEHHSRFGRI